MKEKPILFSTPMVKAILGGRKTMTRRVVKPQPADGIENGGFYPTDENGDYSDKSKHYASREHFLRGLPLDYCPYGMIGDRLWVRETFADTYELGDYPGEKMYKATYLQDYSGQNPLPETWDVKWKPSIFMPRWASRITLEITNVKVERLQDITIGDARKEGLFCEPMLEDSDTIMVRHPFVTLWDSINGKKYPWSANPWVWVIEFTRI